MTDLQDKLQPPETKGHVSVAKLDEWWYVACLSTELRRGPMKRR